jgi:hypothetical protein
MIRGPGADPPAPAIVGCDAECARIRQFLTGGAERASSPLLVVGEPGSGESALLDAAVAEAAVLGRGVLRCAGHEGERELAFAGLHQLLEPVLPGARHLPAPQRDALLAAFGLDAVAAGTEREQPERLLINLGVLSLLSEAASRQPLLVVVDDVQWLDACSLDALSFVARRVADEPVALLVASRGESVPAQFAEYDRLPMVPLGEKAAEQLLDRQPEPSGARGGDTSSSGGRQAIRWPWWNWPGPRRGPSRACRTGSTALCP